MNNTIKTKEDVGEAITTAMLSFLVMLSEKGVEPEAKELLQLLGAFAGGFGSALVVYGVPQETIAEGIDLAVKNMEELIKKNNEKNNG